MTTNMDRNGQHIASWEINYGVHGVTRPTTLGPSFACASADTYGSSHFELQ